MIKNVLIYFRIVFSVPSLLVIFMELKVAQIVPPRRGYLGPDTYQGLSETEKRYKEIHYGRINLMLL